MNASATRKLRGGYYTPAPIAEFLARWSIRAPGDRVLEPSCGDGEILVAATERLNALGGGSLIGVEFDQAEARKARRRLGSAARIHEADFFALAEKKGSKWQFDAVVGNPPFIRYQFFPEEHREPAFRIMAEQGLRPNRLTNAWLPFVVASIRVLAPGGRLAFVIPAELMQVTYAAQLRAYLAEQFEEIRLVTFRRLLFDGVQQEVVLLLADGAHRGPASIRLAELGDASDLASWRFESEDLVHADMDHATEKWTQYYLTPRELGLVRALRDRADLPRLGDVAEVDVGVVTGRNEFFVLDPSSAKRHGLERHTAKLVGRSAQLRGIVFSEQDWADLATADARCLLLAFDDAPARTLSKAAQRYISGGEAAGHNTGYKTRIRRNWHWVPSVWEPDAFLYRQIHDAPRLVVNYAGATSTDTIHRVRMRNGLDPAQLSASVLNSLTFAFSELFGRSYGGGVLELEPTEAEALPVPVATGLDVRQLDQLVRAGRTEEALDQNDALVLRAQLGLSNADVRRLRQIWKKLRDRRLARR
jgi:adenine-specific DNA methylase